MSLHAAPFRARTDQVNIAGTAHITEVHDHLPGKAHAGRMLPGLQRWAREKILRGRRKTNVTLALGKSRPHLALFALNHRAFIRVHFTGASNHLFRLLNSL